MLDVEGRPPPEDDAVHRHCSEMYFHSVEIAKHYELNYDLPPHHT
jgi:hypothetical protein